MTPTAVHCLETTAGWKRFLTIGGIVLSFGSCVKNVLFLDVLYYDVFVYSPRSSTIFCVKRVKNLSYKNRLNALQRTVELATRSSLLVFALRALVTSDYSSEQASGILGAIFGAQFFMIAIICCCFQCDFVLTFSASLLSLILSNYTIAIEQQKRKLSVC